MHAQAGDHHPVSPGLFLAGARVVTPTGTAEPGWVLVRDGRIDAVGAGNPPQDGVAREDLPGGWLLPGFIDLHAHGGGGAWLSSTDLGDLRRAVEFHLGHGTTTMLGSVAAAPLESMVASVEAVAAACGGELPTLAGIHLEGPFLSKERCGAQDPGGLLPPDCGVMERLLEVGQGKVRTVTIAPELPGALEVVRLVAKAGVLPAVGHTDASHAETTAAVDAGARIATHLFNAMRGLHHRDPGTVGAALHRNEVICEVVNDGVHVRPEIVSLAFHAAGPERIALVTDAMAAAGMPDGEYDFGRVPIRVRGGVATLTDDATIAGSVLTMDAAVRRAVLEVGVPIEDAAVAASATPARTIGIDDRTGSIEPGKQADLVLLDDDLQVVGVMAAGRWVRRDETASPLAAPASV